MCPYIYRLSSIETRNHISKNCVTIQNEEYTYEKTENSKYMHFCALFVLEWHFLLIENYQLVKFYDNHIQCYSLVIKHPQQSFLKTQHQDLPNTVLLVHFY